MPRDSVSGRLGDLTVLGAQYLGAGIESILDSIVFGDQYGVTVRPVATSPSTPQPSPSPSPTPTSQVLPSPALPTSPSQQAPVSSAAPTPPPALPKGVDSRTAQQVRASFGPFAIAPGEWKEPGILDLPDNVQLQRILPWILRGLYRYTRRPSRNPPPKKPPRRRRPAQPKKPPPRRRRRTRPGETPIPKRPDGPGPGGPTPTLPPRRRITPWPLNPFDLPPKPPAQYPAPTKRPYDDWHYDIVFNRQNPPGIQRSTPQPPGPPELPVEPPVPVFPPYAPPQPELPAPAPAPKPTPQRSAQTRSRTQPVPRWLEGLGSALLSRVLTRPGSQPRWQFPFDVATPVTTPVADPVAAPVSPPLTPTQPGGLSSPGQIVLGNLAPQQLAQASQLCRDTARRRKKRRKCLKRYNVAWTSGPRKGKVAGSRCYSFEDVAEDVGRRIGSAIRELF